MRNSLILDFCTKYDIWKLNDYIVIKWFINNYSSSEIKVNHILINIHLLCEFSVSNYTIYAQLNEQHVHGPNGEWLVHFPLILVYEFLYKCLTLYKIIPYLNEILL